MPVSTDWNGWTAALQRRDIHNPFAEWIEESKLAGCGVAGQM
jgi:hypothetical protein